MEERVSSGIPGLDKLIGGGFLKNGVHLISGDTGTGKTILACQFIWDGLQKDENVVYITLEQAVKSIKSQALQFGWDFDKYIQEGKCLIDYVFPKTFDEFYSDVFKKIRSIDAERVVIDSLTLLAMYEKSLEIFVLREKVFDWLETLKEQDVTALVISEVSEGGKGFSRFGFEEYIVDSVIILHYLEYVAGGTPRSLLIRKMRNTKHGTDVYPIEIGKTGLVVKKGV